MDGFFVTFEGIEHCGKTTQAERLARHLETLGREVVRTHEPGGTPLGAAIRELLLYRSIGDVDTVAELMLFAADRAQHVRTLILPSLAEGKIVISDRFTDSTRAYQGFGRGIAADLIDRVIALATDGLTPDVTVLMDIDIETSRSRSASAEDDRIEREEDGFFDRVRNGFLTIAAAEPGRFHVVDGRRPLQDVADDIREATVRRLAARV